MARGRFLSRSISISEQFDALIDSEGYEAGLLVTWMISHLDIEGRIKGDPKSVKATVFPYRADITAEKIEAVLIAAQKADLLKWYEAEGRQCIWFPGFEGQQQGLRKSREADSKVPGYSGSSPGVVREDSGRTPAQGKVSQEKERQGKRSEGADARSSAPADSTPVVCELQLIPKDGTLTITEAMVAEWSESFPGVDVGRELLKACQWARDNPTKRKTKRGARKFLGGWLGRVQDKGGVSQKHSALAAGGRPSYLED